MVGSLVDHRANKPYILVGPPVRRPVLAPLAVYSSTTDYAPNKNLTLVPFQEYSSLSTRIFEKFVMLMTNDIWVVIILIIGVVHL